MVAGHHQRACMVRLTRLDLRMPCQPPLTAFLVWFALSGQWPLSLRQTGKGSRQIQDRLLGCGILHEPSPADKGENLFSPPTHNITSASPVQTRSCCLFFATMLARLRLSCPARLCPRRRRAASKHSHGSESDKARVLIGTRRASLGHGSYDVKCAAVDS